MKTVNDRISRGDGKGRAKKRRTRKLGGVGVVEGKKWEVKGIELRCCGRRGLGHHPASNTGPPPSGQASVSRGTPLFTTSIVALQAARARYQPSTRGASGASSQWAAGQHKLTRSSAARRLDAYGHDVAFTVLRTGDRFREKTKLSPGSSSD